MNPMLCLSYISLLTCTCKGNLHFDLPLSSFLVELKGLLTPLPIPDVEVGDVEGLYAEEWLHCLKISSRFAAAVWEGSV